MATETIIFFVICGVIVLMVLAVLFSVIKSLLKLFRKEKKIVKNDEGADLDIIVDELEKSRAERAKIEIQKFGYATPIKSEANKEPVIKSDKQIYTEKEQKIIASGLERLRGADVPESSFMEQHEDGRPVAAQPPSASAQTTKTQEVAKPLGKKDTSFFGGKSEVSRSQLRQELGGKSAYGAAQKVGLNLSAEERVKLEKTVFSQSYGGNISKTDLKRGIGKLNQKMINAKNPGEHEKIRKQINFFKKIGGIKG